ncbi:MAG TPA: anti-sigma factor [Afifellaceae bacterium]|nr:anti-sigma factor [Afifellaceae bacterium]
MTGARVLGDAEMHAYLDGELSEEDRRTSEAWLADDPEARQRLAAFVADRERLSATLAPILQEPLPAGMQALLADGGDSRRRWNWWPIAASIALFGLGSLTGWTASEVLAPRLAEPRPVIAEQAIDAHLVYLPEVRHPVEVGVDERDHLVNWLSKRLGHPLDAPDLSNAGFQLIGGRLLPAGGTAAAQFMYEDERGERLTLLVGVNPDGRQTAFKLRSRGRTQSFYWFDGPFGYALTGDVGEDTLLRLARSVYAQLEARRAAG